MYRSSPLGYPKEKVYLFQSNQQEKTILAQEVQGEEKERREEDKEVSTNPQVEVEDEYDTDSEKWKSFGRRWWRWFPYIYEGSNNA